MHPFVRLSLAFLAMVMLLHAAPARAATDERDIVMAFWTQVWQGGDLDAIDRLMAEDFKIHSAGRTVGPRDRFKTWVGSFFANIEDLEFEVLDIFADGPKVATRWVCRGTLTGEMFGVKGTGQAVAFTGINIMVVENGLITESWVERDALGLAQSLQAAR